MSDQVEDELIQALQGDPEAIRSVAQRLNAREDAMAGHTVAAVNTLVTNRQRFLAAADHFRGEFRDICESPEWWALAQKLDAEEGAKNPNEDYLPRLRKVGFKLRRMRDGNPDHDHKAAIRTMYDKRKRPNDCRQLNDDEEMQLEDESHASNEHDLRRWEREEAEREAERREEIAEMRRSREPEVIAARQGAERRKLQQQSEAEYQSGG